ncbi:bifunctional UDP-3-O-[3-hydroxymyristoyl] N-acetylglucosamine deacetylase/3-hydroxyacyl-ACP dehydratase [Bacteroidetes bacterium endosymbiont of Geopemphigus sp.]|uniref:bifunctional UDP-3-O-[3-hydroxymyristoyl] N-acetylglucosamine deacetylase/3-hydroxyacyl-ACP dehydratase n=1 Tax=Bacteroidetes bacterium endosymbiont of Geopemphigus sp. TaxID=2047937 RepID=UPI000CD28CE3|nr:bifunctional UDP-3-O-[3-hydroxymyristoyl] N-acetylglucosamine deacetylase/3-hydroxyacyl-ACP dehydratase [Bacteroidetes bacterium endosymbiont of Geopemphigus sp.]
MLQKQKTLLKKVYLTGFGLHTAKEVHISFKPAPENTGFVFVRIDLPGSPQVPAHIDLVKHTDRSTAIEKDGVKILTVEHVLAALTGADLDNVIIEVDSEELPIMDGSALPFINVLEQAGSLDQQTEREYYELSDIISYTDTKTGSEITALPSKGYDLSVMVDFDTEVLGSQNAILTDLRNFKKEIASARTFCFFHELESLITSGLIKGGDLNNAIVYVDKNLKEEQIQGLQKIFQRNDLQVLPNGTLNNVQLHSANEAARHKLLDVVGDLALIGKYLKAKIIAYKPGHQINTQFAKKLFKNIQKKNTPRFDLNKTVYDINKIMKLLPHRPPFLLIDRIIDLTERYVVGIKNITMNEPFFVGHFPEEPVFPGVLQVEAMAQAGGIFVLSQKEDPKNYSTYFMKIDNVRFKQKVIPGDLMILKMELLQNIRMGIVRMQGHGYVNEKIVVEAEVTAQVVRTKVSRS